MFDRGNAASAGADRETSIGPDTNRVAHARINQA